MDKPMIVALLILFMVGGDIYAQGGSMERSNADKDSRIRIVIGEMVLTAKMNGSPASIDFMSMLPMTLKLEDYAGTEKISNLPRKLSLKDSPAGSDPAPGDIAYYAPWGNLAVFYKDFGYSSGLLILGRLDSGLEVFSQSAGPIEIRIEREGT